MPELTYFERIALGMCGIARCPRPSSPGKSVCGECGLRNLLYSRKRREVKKSQRLCVEAGCRCRPVPGGIRCEYHRRRGRQVKGEK